MLEKERFLMYTWLLLLLIESYRQPYSVAASIAELLYTLIVISVVT